MQKAIVNIGSRVFRADVADDIFSRAKGLSGREALAADEAMFFVFPLAWRYTFWMKGMKFDLDIVWIRKGLVVDISENIPAPAKNDSIFNIPKVKPSVAADAVLEIKAGIVRAGGIKIGDKVEIVRSS
jgi:uncharacterized membrane protein (UPF0127 family)